MMRRCTLCPRECGADRFNSRGFCGEGADVRIARASLHKWEEPCISGKNGAGTVFFTGCVLRCSFCQNYEISQLGKGFVLTKQQRADTFLMLADMGAENIDLVTPTHFTPQIIEALDLVKHRLKIPVVFNCGGYEKPGTLEMLRGYVDVSCRTSNTKAQSFPRSFLKRRIILRRASRPSRRCSRSPADPGSTNVGCSLKGLWSGILCFRAADTIP